MRIPLLVLSLVTALLLGGCDVVAEQTTTEGELTLPEGIDPIEVDIPQPPCNEALAEEAVVSMTEFSLAVTVAGKARAVLEGGTESDFPSVRFGKQGYSVEMIECADITDDRIDEMIVGIAPEGARVATDWAIFTPEDAANWQLVFPMDGSPVSSFEIADGSLNFETPTFKPGAETASAKPAGSREGTVSFDAEEERFVLDVPGAPKRGKIKTTGGNVVKLGSLDVVSADQEATRKAFGEPTTVAQDGNTCMIGWSDIGVLATFADFGGGDPCSGSIGSIELLGGPALNAGWVTEEGVKVGDPVKDVRKAYPDAIKRRGELILVSGNSSGAVGQSATVTAVILSNRVIGLRLFIGAAGE